MDSTKEQPLDTCDNTSQLLLDLMLQVSILEKENTEIKSEIKRLQLSLNEQD